MSAKRLEALAAACLTLFACLAVAACGGDAQPVRPASDTQGAGAEGGEGEAGAGGSGGDAVGQAGEDGGAGRDGEDGQRVRGRDGASSSSSSTIVEGGDGDSSSVVQSSGSGSVSSTSSGGVQTFSGDGPTKLTFDVSKPSRLSWTTARGERFTARGAGVSIDSDEASGEASLEPGRYGEVAVRGEDWTIVVRPR